MQQTVSAANNQNPENLNVSNSEAPVVADSFTLEGEMFGILELNLVAQVVMFRILLLQYSKSPRRLSNNMVYAIRTTSAIEPTARDVFDACERRCIFCAEI